MSSFNQNIIKHKIGLLNLAEELGNVSKVCKRSKFKINIIACVSHECIQFLKMFSTWKKFFVELYIFFCIVGLFEQMIATNDTE